MHQTSGAEVPGSNPASPTMSLMRYRIIVNNVENLRLERENLPLREKKQQQYNTVHVFYYRDQHQ